MTPLHFFHELVLPVHASLAFIYVLLPAAMLVWYFSPRNARPATMLGTTLGLFALASPDSFVLILSSSLCDYFLTSSLCATRRQRWRNLALLACVAKNCFLIIYFGFVTQQASLAPPLGLMVTGVLGIDACLEAYREEIPRRRGFFSFMLYIMFFPRLYTGPVCSFELFTQEVKSAAFVPERVSVGFERFTHGVFKYVVPGYGLHLLHRSVSEIPAAQQTLLSAWVLVVSFAFALYFTLSGVADASRGVCLMLGLTLPRSFYYPYQAHSVTDFFERFNMAAGAFLKRAMPRSLIEQTNRPFADCLCTLIMGTLWGAWLGIRINGALWGALVAVIMLLEKYLYPKLLAGIPTLFCRVYALALNLCGLAVFACLTPSESLDLLKRMFSFSADPATLYNDRILYSLSSNWILLLFSAVLATSLSSWLRGLLRSAKPKFARGLFAITDIAVLAVATVFILGSSAATVQPDSPQLAGQPSASDALRRLESALLENTPFHDELLRLHEIIDIPGLSVSGRQTGFFTGDGYIMRNISPPTVAYVRENIERVVEFAESMRQYRAQTYFMLIPGSGAILQQRLPEYASSVMVNQRQFIAEVYNSLSGAAITIDAYSPLFQRQTQYIYYRTEDNLTALGGFYVYATMMQRMSLGVADFNQFGTDYFNTDYYGDLAAQAGTSDASSDYIAAYPYGGSNRPSLEVTVRHIDADGESKLYHTLFPQSSAELGAPMNIFLGGLSPVTEISSSRPLAPKVLIFGDRTALSYAPFLAANCARVTIVDFSQSGKAFAQVNPADYDKIVFAYSADTFMHTNIPTSAVDLLH